MMTVLNTVEIMGSNPLITKLLIASAIMGIVALICIACAPCSTGSIVVTILAFIVLLGTLVSIFVVPDVPTGKFKIEATFTDDFPFTSVMKEYDVIEQRGDIFLLEPKEREVD